MTRDQLLDAVLRGEPIVVGRLIGTEIDSPSFLDKNTGAVISRWQAVYLVEGEVNRKTVVTTVYHWCEDESEAKDVSARFRKGDKIAVFIRRLSNSNRHWSAYTNVNPELIQDDRPEGFHEKTAAP